MSASPSPAIPFSPTSAGLVPKILMSQSSLGLSAYLAAEPAPRREDLVGLDSALRSFRDLLDSGSRDYRSTRGVRGVYRWINRLFPADPPLSRIRVDAVLNEIRIDETEFSMIRKRSREDLSNRILLPLAFLWRDIPDPLLKKLQKQWRRDHPVETDPANPRETLFLTYLLRNASSHFLISPFFWKWVWSFRPGGHFGERAELYRLFADWQVFSFAEEEAKESYASEGSLWIRALDRYLDVKKLLDRFPYATAEEAAPVLEGAALLTGYAEQAFRRAGFGDSLVSTLRRIKNHIRSAEGDYARQVGLFSELIRLVQDVRWGR